MLTKGERFFRRSLHLTIGLLVAFTAFVVMLAPAHEAAPAQPTPPLCQSR